MDGSCPSGGVCFGLIDRHFAVPFCLDGDMLVCRGVHVVPTVRSSIRRSAAAATLADVLTAAGRGGARVDGVPKKLSRFCAELRTQTFQKFSIDCQFYKRTDSQSWRVRTSLSYEFRTGSMAYLCLSLRPSSSWQSLTLGRSFCVHTSFLCTHVFANILTSFGRRPWISPLERYQCASYLSLPLTAMVEGIGDDPALVDSFLDPDAMTSALLPAVGSR